MIQLAERLEIAHAELDFSYISLDVVSRKSENYGLDRVQSDLYDNLVAHVGEVLRRRVNGQWSVDTLDLNPANFNNEYPYVRVEAAHTVLMPINVWQELDGLEPMNLRKATANEVRQFSLRR